MLYSIGFDKNGGSGGANKHHPVSHFRHDDQLFYIGDDDSVVAVSVDPVYGSQHISMAAQDIHINKLDFDGLHERCSHSSHRALSITVQKRMLDGLEHIQIPPRSKTKCRAGGCREGKMFKRQVGPQVPETPTRVGSHIAADFGGKVPVVGLGGENFYCLLKDLYTACRMIFFMKSLSQWVFAFKKFCVDYKIESTGIGNFIFGMDLLITDSDRIFMSEEMQKLRVQKVIPFRQWFSAPYTHCRIIETDMRWVTEAAVTNLLAAGMPLFLWVYAFMYSVWTLNRVYTTVFYCPEHRYMVPWERMFGIRTHVRDMIKFGAKVHVYIDADSRDMLKPHAWVGFFVAYATHSKGWLIYNPAKLKVFCCYYILVDESIVYGDVMGAAHAQRLSVYRDSLLLHNDDCKQLSQADSVTRSSVLWELLQPQQWHPIHHAPIQANRLGGPRGGAPSATRAGTGGTEPDPQSTMATNSNRSRVTFSDPRHTSPIRPANHPPPSSIPTPANVTRDAVTPAVERASASAESISPEVRALAELENEVPMAVSNRPRRMVSAPQRYEDGWSSKPADFLSTPIPTANTEPNVASRPEWAIAAQERRAAERQARDHIVEVTSRGKDAAMDNIEAGRRSPSESEPNADAMDNEILKFMQEQDKAEVNGAAIEYSRARDVVMGPDHKSNSSFFGIGHRAVALLQISFMAALSATSVCPNDICLGGFGNFQLQDEWELHNLGMAAFVEAEAIARAGYVDPKGVAAAMKRPEPERTMFRRAMIEEADWGLDSHIYQPAHCSVMPSGYIPLDSLWVFHMKFLLSGAVDRARARLAPRGDQQIEGLEYHANELYAPVARQSSFFIIFIIMVQYGLMSRKVDISKAFFSGSFNDPVSGKRNTKKIFMKVPEGFRETHPKYAPYGPGTVWEILMTAYGLKQAASAYYRKFAVHMESCGWRRLAAEMCVFVKGRLGSASFALFGIWVDDKILTYASQSDLDGFVADLENGGYKFRDEGTWNDSAVLGTKVVISPDKRQLSISSDAYVTLQGTKFDLMKRTPKSRPCTKETVAAIDNAVRPTIHEMQTAEWKALYKRFRSILGAIMHIVKWTCPQVMFAVSVASTYMSCPCVIFLFFARVALRHLLRLLDHSAMTCLRALSSHALNFFARKSAAVFYPPICLPQ